MCTTIQIIYDSGNMILDPLIFFHLAGSIDEYQNQLIEFKRSAADAGLDFGQQIADDQAFLHVDTILHRFCDDVFAMTAHGTKEALSGVNCTA